MPASSPDLIRHHAPTLVSLLARRADLLPLRTPRNGHPPAESQNLRNPVGRPQASMVRLLTLRASTILYALVPSRLQTPGNPTEPLDAHQPSGASRKRSLAPPPSGHWRRDGLRRFAPASVNPQTVSTPRFSMRPANRATGNRASIGRDNQSQWLGTSRNLILSARPKQRGCLLNLPPLSTAGPRMPDAFRPRESDGQVLPQPLSVRLPNSPSVAQHYGRTGSAMPCRFCGDFQAPSRPTGLGPPRKRHGASRLAFAVIVLPMFVSIERSSR